MHKKTIFRLFLMFALGIGLTCYRWDAAHWLLGTQWLRDALIEVLPKLGDALLIAPIVIITIEFAAARELLNEFAKNVSHHIIGRILPPELREHMFRHLTVSFLKKHWSVEYWCEEIPDHTGALKVITCIISEIENRSDREEEYDFSFQIEKSWFPEIDESRITKAEVTCNDTTLVELAGHGLNEYITEEASGITFSKKVKIKEAPHKYTFFLESVEYLPLGYNAQFVTKLPALETVLRVNYPKDRLNVSLDLSFAEESRAFKREIPTGTEWLIKTPILTGQSFSTKWYRAPLAAEARPEPSAALEAAEPDQPSDEGVAVGTE